MNANSNQAWTIAWRTPRANRFLRATNWTGTWSQAMNMTRAFHVAHPDQQVYCVTTAAYEADQAARIASGELSADYAEDFGNILMETGRRVRMIDKGIIDADLVAQTFCDKCIGGQTGDSLAGTWPTPCADCDVAPQSSTYAEGDSVQDTKWGGTYTGTVTRVDDDGAIFVQWHGTSVEDELTAADIVPAPGVPRPDGNGLRYLTV